MYLQVCSVFDSAVNCYSRPFCVPAIAQAVRTFVDEVNRVAPDNELNRHPEDFDLFHLGVFDDATGLFSNLQDGAKMISEGRKVLRV